MSSQRSVMVTPIRLASCTPDRASAVADLAYDIWLSDGSFTCSPQDALFIAIRALRDSTTRGLFIVPRAKPAHHPLYVEPA